LKVVTQIDKAFLDIYLMFNCTGRFIYQIPVVAK